MWVEYPAYDFFNIHFTYYFFQILVFVKNIEFDIRMLKHTNWWFSWARQDEEKR